MLPEAKVVETPKDKLLELGVGEEWAHTTFRKLKKVEDLPNATRTEWSQSTLAGARAEVRIAMQARRAWLTREVR